MYSYILRVCDDGNTSHGGFKWPEFGQVSCNDWDPSPENHYGLHGILINYNEQWLNSCILPFKNWLVVKVLTKNIVIIDNCQVKFPEGTIIYCGNHRGAMLCIINELTTALLLEGPNRITVKNLLFTDRCDGPLNKWPSYIKVCLHSKRELECSNCKFWCKSCHKFVYGYNHKKL